VRSSKHSGISLIEVVVVLALIGLSLKAVAPSIADWLNTVAVRSAAESIKAGVDKARQDALRRNETMGFWLVQDSKATLSSACVLSSSGPSWVVAKSDPAGKCDEAPSESTAPRIREKWSAAELASKLVIDAVNAKGNAAEHVEFDSLGRPGVDQVARIEIRSVQGSARRLHLLINAGGSVRLCEPDVASTDTRKC
jgi:type IV fimbrial biogenesis protein FimT